MSWQAAAFIGLGAVLLGGFAWYERSRPPSQIVALVAALAALAVAGRVVVAPIPNVVATTDIAIFSGYALGGPPGFVVGALAGLISNFWLGQGPWTPWQMAGWGLAGMLGALLARASSRRAGRLELTLACGFAGIAYGALLNFSLMVSYGGELTLDRFLTLQVRAVPFDLAHAIGNIGLALVAGPAMVRMLIRFRERFEFEWARVDARPSTQATATAGAVGLLLAVAVIGAAGMGARPVAAAGGGSALDWLEQAQNRDGGFPRAPGEDSSTEMTGWAMLGLEAAGVNPRQVENRGRSPIDYLRGHLGEVRTSGDLARTILALRGARVDPRNFSGRDLAARLSTRRRGDGSYQGWPNSTAFAVMALRASGVRGGVRRSLAWLRRVQNRDGGWGSVPGAPSDPDSTGAVLQAIGAGPRAAGRGARYLRRSQRASGGWALAEAGAVNSQSTAWAVQGLLGAGVDPGSVRSDGRSGFDYLAARRASDGHYRYSSTSDQTPVWVTGQVLAAVELRAFPLAPVPRSTNPSNSPSGGGGEGAPSPSLTRDSRGPAKRGSPSGEARSRAKRSGGATAPPATPPEGEVKASTALTATGAGEADQDSDGGGPSPLVPIGIGIGAAGLAAGTTWLLGRRRPC